MNAISDTLENLDNVDYEKEVYKVGDVLITSRTDLDDTWTLANGGDATVSDEILELQANMWRPGYNITDENLPNTFYPNSDCFYDGESIYYLSISGKNLVLNKINSSGSVSTTNLKTGLRNPILSSKYRSNPSNLPDIINGYAMVTMTESYGTNQQNHIAYVCYSQNFKDWTVKQLFTFTGQNIEACASCHYINNEYIFTLTHTTPYAYASEINIVHGVSLDNLSSVIHIKNTRTNNRIPYFITCIPYYNGKYYLMCFTNTGSLSGLLYESASSIDDLQGNFTHEANPNDTNGSFTIDAIEIAYQMGKYLIVLDSQYIDLSTMECITPRYTMDDKYIIYKKENSIYILNYNSSQTHQTAYYEIILSGDNLIVNQYEYSGGYGDRNPYVKYGKYELYYITESTSSYANVSTPQLPEVSVNNAYAYVKVSSS